MSKRIVVVNQKGGVGKTTTTVNLGAYLAEAGHSVLLIDFDPQANLSSSVGIQTDGPNIYEVISGNRSIRDAVHATAVNKLHIIPSNINLAGANVELIDADRREHFLRTVIDSISNDFEYILIDCPPSLGILTINGLAAAHHVLIPLQCEYFAMEGLAQLLRSIKVVQQRINTKLNILGIVFTMYDARTRLSQDVVREVISYFGKRVFQTIIPRNIRLSEAPSHGTPINIYDSECAGAKSYKSLSKEVIAHG